MVFSKWLTSTGQASKLSFSETMEIQSWLEGAARMVIYVYTLSVALFAFAKYNDFFAIAIISGMVMLLSLIYGMYVAVEAWIIMKQHSAFGRFNYIYYLLLFIGLFLIFILLGINYKQMWESTNQI